ncbi:MAG: diguanylate cyclase [Arcobacter sp.]|nr:diguanylate cyclase [Arcobacter sp.]
MNRILNPKTFDGRLRRFIINLMLFIVLVTTIFLIYMMRTQISETFKKELNSIISMQNQAIDKWLNERELDIRFLANNFIIKGNKNEDKKAFLENFINSQSEFYSVAIVDLKGYALIDSTLDYKRYFGDKNFFQDSLNGLDSISTAEINSYNNIPVLHFSSPVFNEYNEVISVIVGAVRLSSIQAIIEGFRFSKTGETFIINKNKQLLTKRKFDKDIELLTISDNTNISKGFYTSYNGNEVLGDVIKSNFGEWLIVAQISKNEIYEVFEQFLIYVLVFIFSLLIIIIPLILKFSNKIVKPLKFLLNGSQQIEDGDYGHEIDSKLISKASIEIQDLTHSFNSMSRVLKKVIGELTLQSTIDVLTKLYNRRELLRLSKDLFINSMNDNKSIAVLMIDIDHFKKVNDNYGHRTGDIVIERVANTIKTSLTDVDVPGRYGGEEFMVFIADINYNSVESITNRILNNVRKLVINNDNNSLKCTCSIGVFFTDNINKELSLEEAIELSDQSLYMAKNSGRNRVVINGHLKIAS